MEIQKKSSNRTKWLIAVIAVVLIGAGGATAWYVSGQKVDKKADETTTTDTKDKSSNSPSSSNTTDKNTTNPSNSTIESEKGISRDETNPPTESLGIWVTSKVVDNGTLRIRVQIDQNISSGTCILTIGNFSTSVPVAFEPQSASCQGFDVPTSEYSGNDFTIKVTSGDKSGSVAGVINE